MSGVTGAVNASILVSLNLSAANDCPESSIIATPARKSFSDVVTPSATEGQKPKANAMSVAAGIAQPRISVAFPDAVLR